MISDSVLHEVSVYLKGDNLVPEELTARLGVEPTRSHKTGDKSTTSTGVVVVKKTGLWALRMEAKSVIDLPVLIDRIASRLMLSDVPLAKLPGVEEAYLDVFIAKNADHHGGGTCEFTLDSASFLTLARLALPMQFTVIVTGSE